MKKFYEDGQEKEVNRKIFMTIFFGQKKFCS